MPDDKSKRGKPDRSRVAEGEAYEVAVLQKKFPSLLKSQIKRAIKVAGPSRAAVEKKLRTLLDD